MMLEKKHKNAVQWNVVCGHYHRNRFPLRALKQTSESSFSFIVKYKQYTHIFAVIWKLLH
jgi:hypothetical protein